MPSPNTICEFGEFEIQPDFNTITCDGNTTQLSPRVMDVLMYLVKNSDRIVPANELLDAFWADRIVEESTIHRHISQVRTALGDSAREARYIKTVSKRGYQAVAPITMHSPASVQPEIIETTSIKTSPPTQDGQFAQPENGISPTTSNNTEENPYVFISYSHKDSTVVTREINWLESQGVQVWYDKGISPGSNWLSVIGDALLGANTVLFFVSKRSLASEHCNREVSLALEEGITIIPIYLDDVELTSDLKVGLSRVQALRLKEQGFRTQLLQTLTFLNKDNAQSKIQPVATVQTKRSRTLLIIAAALALILTIAGVASFQYFSGKPEESIAVLPFKNLSERESVGFFAQGLSDSILDELAAIGHVKVAARTTSFQLSEQGVELGEIAERLNVDYVLEGTVQEQGGILRITVQLIRASDGYHVVSKTYQKPFKDSFAAQRQISRNISQKSHDSIFIDLQRQFPSNYEHLKGVKPEAVNLYLDANENFNQLLLGDGGDMTVAYQLLQRAVVIDPDFMMAHRDLAQGYGEQRFPGVPVLQASEYAHAAIEKMRELDADQNEIAFTLSQIYTNLDLDYASAEKLIKQQIAEKPKDQWWRTFLADIAFREGRLQEGLDLMKADATVQPDFAKAEFIPLFASVQMYAGNYQESLKIIEQALDLYHEGSNKGLGLLIKADTLLRMNRREDATPLLDEAWNLTQGRYSEKFAHLFARTGQPERARTALEKALVNQSNRASFALGFESLGEIDTVFELIHDGIIVHDKSIIFIMRTNVFSKAVLQDPRFQDMLDLLDSKAKYTPRYLQTHDASAVKSF